MIMATSARDRNEGNKMIWITENPFPAIMIGMLAIGASFTFGWILQDRRLLAVGVLSILVTFGAVVIERLIVTDREKVQQTVHLMAREVRKNDLEGLLSYVAEDTGNARLVNARKRFNDILPKVTFYGCRLANLNVTVDGNNAKATFVAFVNVETDLYGHVKGPGSRRCLLKFEKADDGRWLAVFFDHQGTDFNLGL